MSALRSSVTLRSMNSLFVPPWSWVFFRPATELGFQSPLAPDSAMSVLLIVRTIACHKQVHIRASSAPPWSWVYFSPATVLGSFLITVAPDSATSALSTARSLLSSLRT